MGDGGCPVRGRLRIAILGPPWIVVPPPDYGGIEAVIALLSDALVDAGHDVTLFAAPGSRSKARVVPLLDAPKPHAIERSVHEADHVARAFAAIDSMRSEGLAFDVVHDNCGYTGLAFSDRLQTPLVHTVHVPFDEDRYSFYAAHAGKAAALVTLSRAQLAEAPRSVRDAAVVVPNPLFVDDWPLREQKEDYLLWVGRMSPEKGAHVAIDAAEMAGRSIVLAGPIQRGQEEYFASAVEPRIDGSAVRYVGAVGGTVKRDLFAGAAALLMPIGWTEPFGMVMIEAMATGTPVIAFPNGSAPELLWDGRTGFLVNDAAGMAAATRRLGDIDGRVCRANVVERFDVRVVAAAYEEIYRRVMAHATAR
jgi:glycosyltransferase involved in cell wall biosynthesis